MASRGFLVGDHNIRPHRRPVRYVASKQTKPTRRKKKKPEWDSSVNDLTVHKATKEEQIRRHELHKSKNVSSVHLQSKFKDRSLDSTIQTPDTVERRKLAIVQEVLYGQDKFQDVLSESDKAMSVVKDLFGDDPKKFMGFPNITAAPSNVLYGKENKFPVGPVAEMPETPTHLSLLSDSIMRTPALNELPGHDKEDEELSPGTPPSGHERITFQPMLDLQRFQQYVAEEQSKHPEHPIPTLLTGSGASHVPPSNSIGVGQATIPSTDGIKVADEDSGLFHEGRGTDHVAAHGGMVVGRDYSSQPPSFLSQGSSGIVIAGGPNFVKPGEPTSSKSIPPSVREQSVSKRHGAEADPQGSDKTKIRTNASHKPPSNSSSSGLQSLNDLKKMVEELENEVAAYEYETGRQQTKLPSPLSTGSFSGYTGSLITAVTKLMSYLKESEVQRKAEMVMREQVLQGFEEQRALVDALTNDILYTQEQNLALQHELLEYRKTTDEQLQYLKRELFAVLRSYEYQALSTSINTLYSLNPAALKKRGFDALHVHPMYDENQNLEYLPGAPVSQDHENGEQKGIGKSMGRDLTEDNSYRPSFIPVATTQDQDVPLYTTVDRMARTSQQDSQADNQPVSSSDPMNGNTLASLENYSREQQHSMASTASSVSQNGYVPLAYQDSGSTHINHGMPSHSHIVMYPPSQVTFTHAGRREACTVQPQLIAAGIPTKPHIPPVQHQLVQASSSTKVVPSGPSTPPSHSAHQQKQDQVQSRQPTVLNAMEPRPGGPQGFPAKGHLLESQGHAGQSAIANAMEPRPHGPQGRHPQVQGHAGEPTVANAMEPRSHGPQGRHPQVQGHAGGPAVANAMEPRPHGPQGRHPEVQGHAGELEVVNAMEPKPGGPQGFLTQGHLPASQAHAGQPAIANAMEPRPHGPQGRHPQVQGHAGQPVVVNAMQPRPHGPQGRHPQVQGHAGQPAVANAMEPRPRGPQGGHLQVQRHAGHSAVATAMEPMQGSLIPPKGAYPRFSEAVPSTLPLHVDDSRLAFLNHVTMPEAIGKAGQAVTSSQSLSLLHHQHQPPQQVLTQPFPRVEHVPKSRGFAPVSRTMIGGIPANHQLRERLQNLANRQRSLATRSGDQDIGNLQGMEGQQPRPNSPHVHFQEPPVAVNGHDKDKTRQEQNSPPVSPIPYKNPTVPTDKRVVVNLPNAWSDVSSTISL